MKKAFSFLVLCCWLVVSCVVYGQNGDMESKFYAPDYTLTKSYQKTLQALRVTVVQDSSTVAAPAVWRKLDTLSSTDTFKIAYFPTWARDAFVTLYDSSAADTFYVQRYDTLAPYASKLWTLKQAGLIDISTPYIGTQLTTGRYGLSGTGIVIPGAGITKTYWIFEPHPMTYMVWMPASVLASNKKRYIKWSAWSR